MKDPRPALSVEDWTRLNRLLAEGLELDEDERSGWQERLASEPAHLRTVLLELLAEARGVQRGHDRPQDAIARVASEALSAMHLDRPGHLIGHWRLERLLAEGGMGSVWLAERADGVMRRTAALKLPRAEWIDRGLSERIARERTILARLKHPNIAVLYDAGVTAEGRPYLALEYVEGEPIDAYARNKKLALADLLRLFIPVVRAVAYAHSRLIIHRDIKPGNILVTPDGLPKLLDFGVSKLIEGEQTSAEVTALTQLAGRPLTLAYAAPEQLLGSPVTIAIDVYALGAVLFEIATGSRLYRSTSPYALEQEVLAGDLRRPSDVARDRRRAHELRGDLEAIILTALKRAPEERYSSAAALADDLERYLAGEAVQAHADSRAYRLRKFVNRNRGAVAAAGAIALAIGVGMGAALWQANIAREQANEAHALNAFVLSLIRSSDPAATQQSRKADVATLAAIEERIDREFKGSPAQLLRLRVTIGDAYRNRGELVAAQRAYQLAVEQTGGSVAPDDLQLLAAQVRLADPRMIVSADQALRLARAIEVLRSKGAAGAELLIDALVIQHELTDEFGIPEYRSLAHRFDALGEALEVASRYFGEGSGPYLKVLLRYALLVDDAGDRPQARRLIEESMAPARERLDNFAASPEYLDLERFHHAFLCGTDRAAEGLAGLWHAVEATRLTHDETSVRLENLYGTLGLCYERIGDSASTWFYRAAFDIAAARERPPSVQLMRRAYSVMSRAIDVEDFATADEYYRKALENTATRADPALREKLSRRVAMGGVCLSYYLGNAEEAEQRAAAILEALRGLPDVRLTFDEVKMRRCLSYAQREQGRYAEAAATAEALLERCRGYAEGWLRCRNRGLLALAFARLDGGRADEALALMAEREQLPLRPTINTEADLLKGRALLAVGRIAEATSVLEGLNEYWRSARAPRSYFAAEAEYWTGKAYLAAGDRRGQRMVAEAQRGLAASPLKSHQALAAHDVAVSLR